MRFAQPTLALAFSILATVFAGVASAQQSTALASTAACCDTRPVGPAAPASVLVSSTTIARTAELRQFNELLSMTGLRQRLSKSTEAYTVFAPTNEAVQKLPATVRERMFRTSSQALQHLLRSHIMPGTITFDQLKDGAELKTMDGEIVRVARQADGTVLLNGVYRLHDTGRLTANGVIYTIDAVMAPAN